MKITLIATWAFILGGLAGATISAFEYDAILNAAIHAGCPVPMSETAYDACVVGVLEGR